MSLAKLVPGFIKKRIKATRWWNDHHISVYLRKGGGGLSFSQKGEDFIVRGIFDCLGINQPSYIDVGANNPFILSNTALFYKRGSRGINIEPNPVLFRTIQAHRKEDTNIMAGIGLEKSTMPFYVLNAHVLSTFSKNEADMLCEKYGGKYGYRIEEVIQVNVIRYDKYVQSYTKFILFILWHSREVPSCFNEPDFAGIAGYFRLV